MSLADKFKIRSSAAGKICKPRGLGETGKTYIKEWLKEEIYKRRPDIKSKYIEKGNFSEEDGFTLMATQLNLGMVYKNKQYYSNGFMHGTPDLIVDKSVKIVYDNKCSWDLSTFPMFETECPNDDYEWQLQSYIELTGADSGVLAYTLIDAAEWEVEKAIKWEADPNKIYKVINQMVYSKEYFETLVERFCPLSKLDYFVEIPEEKRIKTFEIKKRPEAIALIKDRVAECKHIIKNTYKL